jgi:hypothetical protein
VENCAKTLPDTESRRYVGIAGSKIRAGPLPDSCAAAIAFLFDHLAVHRSAFAEPTSKGLGRMKQPLSCSFLKAARLRLSRGARSVSVMPPRNLPTRPPRVVAASIVDLHYPHRSFGRSNGMNVLSAMLAERFLGGSADGIHSPQVWRVTVADTRSPKSS